MNLFEAAPALTASGASEFNDAVNASRFVKGFGVAVLVYAVLLFLGINLLSSAVGIGTGLFIFRYDAGRFYRVLGVTVILLALVAPLPFLSPIVLAASILWKGMQVLGILERSPKGDPDWAETRSRTVLGMVASAAGLLVCLAIMLLVIVAIAMAIVQGARS